MPQIVNNLRRKRVIHGVFSALAATIVFISLLGVVLLFVQVNGASSTALSIAIIDPSQQNSQPPAPTGPTGNGSLINYLLTPPEPLLMPTSTPASTPVLTPTSTPSQSEPSPNPPLSLQVMGAPATEADNTHVSTDAQQQTIPTLSDARPVFQGNAGAAGNIIFLELHPAQARVKAASLGIPSDDTMTELVPSGGKIITASITAGLDGSWSWQPPEDLANQLYVLYTYVFDPTGSIRLGSLTFAFEIHTIASANKAPAPKPVATPASRTSLLLPPSLVDQRKVLFDISVKILSEKGGVPIIKPGDTISLQFSLLNIGSPGYLVDSRVTYALIGPDGKQLIQKTETVAVATQASYIRRIATQPTLQNGQYIVEASVEYEDTKAVAQDSFVVSGSPAINLTATTRVPVTAAFQVLVGIFALATLIMYMEFRNVVLLGRIIHQVTMDDLKKTGMI